MTSEQGLPEAEAGVGVSAPEPAEWAATGEVAGAVGGGGGGGGRNLVVTPVDRWSERGGPVGASPEPGTVPPVEATPIVRAPTAPATVPIASAPAAVEAVARPPSTRMSRAGDRGCARCNCADDQSASGQFQNSRHFGFPKFARDPPRIDGVDRSRGMSLSWSVE